MFSVRGLGTDPILPLKVTYKRKKKEDREFVRINPLYSCFNFDSILKFSISNVYLSDPPLFSLLLSVTVQERD